MIMPTSGAAAGAGPLAGTVRGWFELASVLSSCLEFRLRRTEFNFRGPMLRKRDSPSPRKLYSVRLSPLLHPVVRIPAPSSLSADKAVLFPFPNDSNADSNYMDVPQLALKPEDDHPLCLERVRRRRHQPPCLTSVLWQRSFFRSLAVRVRQRVLTGLVAAHDDPVDGDAQLAELRPQRGPRDAQDAGRFQLVAGGAAQDAGDQLGLHAGQGLVVQILDARRHPFVDEPLPVFGPRILAGVAEQREAWPPRTMSGKKSASNTGPVVCSTDWRTTLCSSRTLPGQA